MRSGELKSLKDFAVDNILCAGRNSYYQRIVIVSKHKLSCNMKNTYLSLCSESNRNVQEDKLTGLVLIYRQYGVLLFEGPEVVLGKIIAKIATKKEQCVEASKIIIIYNNANQVHIDLNHSLIFTSNNHPFQRFFNKIISRMGEPVSRTDADLTNLSTLDIISKFLRTLHTLSRKINSDDVDDSKT